MTKPFTYPFRYVPSPEVQKAAGELIARISSDPYLDALFKEGKMMGVLVCAETVLYGFSGVVTPPDGPAPAPAPAVTTIPAQGIPTAAPAAAKATATVPGFVPPIFDYTAPDGYFRKREAEITSLAKATATAQHAPTHNAADPAAMSRDLQDWLFSQYKVLNASGSEASIKDIFAERGLVPPGGTGECAAPKLLNYAFRNGLTPLSMGEFWYGASPASQVREQGRFYPSCTGKCGPLLTWMLQGLTLEPNPLDAPFVTNEPKIIYEDADIVVVNKPGGMLSVPGKTQAPCLLDWLSERYGEVHSCHRLDQDTSGVMVYARNLASKVHIENQFASRQVSKTYRARLSARLTPWDHARKGTIALPLALDYYERPCQMVDHENGKMAVTRYEVLEILPNGEVEVRFFPQTGRTHQLRVHSAHVQGLGRPIKGDHLYGAPDGSSLYLMAETITLTHPSTGQSVTFSV